MKKLLLLFFLIPSVGFSQLFLSEKVFNLGEISQLNEDVIDLNIVNQSDEAIFILRIESASGVAIKFTSKNLKPNSAELIRIKLNPKKTGKIKEEVKFYFSSNQTPTTIEITADVKIIPKDNRQACPNFTSTDRPQANFQQFANEQQAGEISSFFVELIPEKNRDQWQLAKEEMLINNSNEAIAEKSSAEQVYSQKELVQKKEKMTPEERGNAPSIIETLFGNMEDVNEQKNVNVTEPLEQNEHLPSITLNTIGLDNSFKPNNIVFLIDASTSMREDERMDLLKKAMINLLESLREIDYLSIVTYSGEATLLLEPTSGVSKEAIRRSIDNITADGSTQAVKGIKKALQTGNSSFIEGGNNQIILATDGAFNIGERNMSLRKKIEESAKNGLTITVLGIKNDRWTNKSLKEISELGNGDLIHINNERDAEKVLEEIKRKSKI